MLDFFKNIMEMFPGITIGAGTSLITIIINIILKKTKLIDKIKGIIDKCDNAIELAEPEVDKAVKKGCYNGGVVITSKMNKSKFAPFWDTAIEPILIIILEGIIKLTLKAVSIFIIKSLTNGISFFVTGLRSDNKEKK